MERAEVALSSGDVMMVKEEEGESDILHLQPILHGVDDDISDMGTTVLAIEAHHDETQAEGEEIEYGYPITCGESRAVLLFKKFVCPGINVRCVKFNEQLISPKQFVHLAGKATLKDWKRAIRLGGVMLRKMMDSGQIDFYQHDTVCSNTCRSTKFDVLVNNTRLSPGSTGQPTPSIIAAENLGQLVPLSGEMELDEGEIESALEQKSTTISELSPGPFLPTSPTPANGLMNKRKTPDIPAGILSLWKGVADIGLMGEVLSSIQTKLAATLKGVEVRNKKDNLQETDAMMLHSLCEMLGLLGSVKQALDRRDSLTESNGAHNMLCGTDMKMGDQRKDIFDEGISHKNVSTKRLQVHGHGHSTGHAGTQSHAGTRHQAGQNLPSVITTDRLIQSLLDTGIPSPALVHLTTQHFTPLTASISASQRHSARVIHEVARLERGGQIATTGGAYEGGERGILERSNGLRKASVEHEVASRIHKGRAVRSETGIGKADRISRRAEVEESQMAPDVDPATGTKRTTKKHKAK